jgi:hypothetical protein
MTDYLCPEGQRLWEEWDAKKMSLDYWPLPERTIEANAAWTAYQDHRAACQECANMTTLDRLSREELVVMIHGLQDIQYDLYKNLEDYKTDAGRLVEEIKSLKSGIVWEEAGEDSPTLIAHNNLVNRIEKS